MKKYQQISEEIQYKIMIGTYRSGDKLPSINEISELYNCSRGTVIKAFEVLISRHVVYSKPQSGYYVANDFYKHELEQDHYDLSTGNPRVDSIPIVNVKHSLNVAVERYSEYSLQMQLRGTPSLLEELQKYLDTKGFYCKISDLFFSQGVTQAMSVLCRIPFPNGKNIILIEEPSFSFTIEQLKHYGNEVLTIQRDKDGIDMAELEHIFKTQAIKFFYTIPRNHNPLGTYLPLNQRKKIIELAHKYDVYIVENDYFSESFSIPRYEPIYYYSDFRNCIYLKSYSKIVPYIRIGFAIIPPEIQEAYSDGMNKAYFESYYMPDLVSQATLETMIKNDIISGIALHLSETLKQKISTYNRIIAKWSNSLIMPQKIQCGNYGIIQLSDDININSFINKLKLNGVEVKSNEPAYYNKDNFDNSFRVCLARVSHQQLKKALQIIYSSVND